MALLELSKRIPDQSLQWHHFGDGELRESIELMTKKFPANIRVKFWGKVLNEDIHKFYRENPIDLFINVSDSEGIPVSIMEAQSFGIPVLATAVGGTPEIVTNENGWLIPGDATASQISNCIASAMYELSHTSTKRSASLETWKNRYDADVNFSAFSELVASI
jgi:glycosyltransferase involved in cell wall biosynthesis